MWVARDKDGTLWLYIDRPKRARDWWEVDTDNTLLREDDCLEINGDLYPELRWDDETIEVELVRKEENL
jgi:hypothetical protein